MNYCLIEDAWGKSISNDLSKRNNFKHDIKEHFHDSKHENMSCKDIINHVRKCNICYNELLNIFSKNKIFESKVESFENLIDDHRETIVLILIGVSILLFFNLVNNITKNN